MTKQGLLSIIPKNPKGLEAAGCGSWFQQLFPKQAAGGNTFIPDGAALQEGIHQQGNVTAGKEGLRRGSDGFPFFGKGSFLPVTPSQPGPSPWDWCGGRSWVENSAGRWAKPWGAAGNILQVEKKKIKWDIFNSLSPTPLLCCSPRSKNPDSQLSLLPRGR